MRSLPPSVWMQIERLYFEGELSVVAIAEQAKINPNTIYARAARRGWPPRSKLRLDGASSERAKLRRIINAKLDRLEKRMADPEPLTEADSDRQTRSVASLAASLGKLDGKEDAWREKVMTEVAQGTPTGGYASYGDDDVEQWRLELAKRIAALADKLEQ